MPRRLTWRGFLAKWWAGRLAAAAVAQMHRANVGILPHLASWRSVTVIAGAFPPGLGPLVRNIWNRIPRSDWLGWHLLVTGSRRPQRLPAYGDYAIADPPLPHVGRATILAQLRYTTPDLFLVWKGHDAHKHASGFGQFHAICANLLTRPDFRGAAFSAGDTDIAAKAGASGSPGNAETWRKIATSHHLETAREQIANLP